MAIVTMKDEHEDVGGWMKNGFAARTFIVKDVLGYGLQRKAHKVFSVSLLFRLIAPRT